MIKSLIINNFQSHKFTKLNFDSGVNVIIGASDSGKSAILRALHWVIFNRPIGDSFKSHLSEEVSVDIVLQDKIVSRKKTKNENLYLIDYIHYRAFNKEVPEEINELLNIDNINIQRQQDAPFLLSLTPGEISKVLNQAVRLEVIDTTQKNISILLKQENQKLLNFQNIIQEKQEELKKYKWLLEAENNVVLLEVITNEILQLSNLQQNLNQINIDIYYIEKTIQDSSKILMFDQDVNILFDLNNQIEAQLKLLYGFNNIINDIIKNEKEIKPLLLITKVDKQINELINLQQNYNAIEEQNNSFKDLINNINNITNTINTKQEQNQKQEQEFKKVFPNVCPLCQK